MKEFIEKFLGKDDSVHSVYNRNTPLNLEINSWDEIIITYRNTIQFYTNLLYNKINEIEVEDKDIIRDFIIIDDYLLLATDNGQLIKYKRVENYKYHKVNVKSFEIKIGFRFILKLKEKNLICCFTKSKIYIINIDLFSIISKLTLPKSLYIDLKTKPFIISKEKPIICFRQQYKLTIFNYKTMKIIKSIDLKKNAPFQLIKEENGNNFYLVSIVFSNLSDDKYMCKTHIEVKKFDINLKILKKSKTKIIMPEFVEEDNYIDEEESNSSYINYFDHYCIYRCIVEDVKNYSFILHGYRGPPYEAEWFWTVYCINGEIQVEVEDKIYKYLSGDGENLDLVFQKFKGKTLLAYTDVENDKINFI